MNVTDQELAAAVHQLERSQKGRGALKHVHDFLEGDGLGLDSWNQRAILTLIVTAWSGRPETVRDLLRKYDR